MSDFKWVGGGISDLQTQLKAQRDDMGEMLLSVLREIVQEAREEMLRGVESAVTPTGLARAEQGGHPGRIETSKMIDSISEKVGVEDKSLYGEWGWLDFQDTADDSYFLYQEYGTDRIEKMWALFNSWAWASPELGKRLREKGLVIA